MAVRFNVIGEGLVRSTNIVAGSADYTAMCWWRRTAAASSYRVILSQIDAGGTAWAGLYDNTTGPFMDIWNGAAGATNDGPLSLINAWMHFAYTRTGTTHRWYINGYLISSATVDTSAVAFAEVRMGSEGFGEPTNHEAAYYREWAAALTAAEIQAEVVAASAVRTANLRADTPLTSDLLDDSGNGNDWTAVGAVSFVSDPLITSIPLNTVGQAAIEFADPASVLQQVYVDGVTYNVWYKATNNGAVDKVISYANWGTLPGALNVDYWPFVEIWTDPNRDFDDPNAFIHQGFFNGSFGLLPLPAGYTYYFNILHQVGNYNPSPLSITYFTGPTALGQVGDVFISAASIASWDIDAGLTGLAGAFIDVDAGVITGYVPQFITGEGGDILPSTGRMFYIDEAGSLNGYPPFVPPDVMYYGYLYSPDFAVLAQVAFGPSRFGGPSVRTHNPSNKVYIAARNGSLTHAYATVDADGVISPILTMPAPGNSVTAIAANAAETILYVASNGAIKRLDLGTNTFLSDLVAAVANYSVTDLLSLSDDSLVACYFRSSPSGSRDVYVQRFNAAGALLNTYTFPGLAGTVITGTAPRLGYSAASPEAFWALNHYTTGFADIRLIRVSDGAVLKSSTSTSDPNQDDDPTATPSLPRSSDCCPIIELRVAQVGPSVGGTLIVQKVLQFAGGQQAEFGIAVGGGLTPTDLTLEGGDSYTYPDVPAGTYSVTEPTIPADWELVSIVASNASPSSAVTVADAETVTVTVTNRLVGHPGCPGEPGDPPTDGLSYAPPQYDPCAGTGTLGAPRTGV